MDFVTMQNRSYDGFRDAPREFILLTEVKDWLNEAQRDIAHRQKVLTKSIVNQVVPNDQLIPLPNDYIDLKGLRFDGFEVEWPDEAAVFGTPSSGPIARVIGRKIQINPLPAAGAIYDMDYAYEPADLVADGAISELPSDLHQKLVFYARAQGFLRLNNYAQAQYWTDRYEEGLEPLSAGKHGLSPQPMEVGYQRGPFDTADAVHRG